MRRAILTACLALMALPARADEPFMTLDFGTDRLAVAFGEVRAERLDDPGALLLTFDPVLGEALAALTETHIGAETVLSLCGAEILRPRVHQQIPDGQMKLTLDPALTDLVFAQIIGLAGCPKEVTS